MNMLSDTILNYNDKESILKIQVNTLCDVFILNAIFYSTRKHNMSGEGYEKENCELYRVSIAKMSRTVIVDNTDTIIQHHVKKVNQ